MYIDLKKLLYNVKGKEYPVSGGLGLDIESRVIISENYYDLALILVKEITDLLIGFFKIDTVSRQQTDIVEIDSHKLAKVSVTFEYEDPEGNEQNETFAIYFDVTLSYVNIGRSLEDVKSTEQIDQLVADNHDNEPKFKLLHHFNDIVATSITYGTSDLSESDLIQLFDVSEDDAKNAMKLLEECGLLDAKVHEYYQRYFGQIYPEGYWELIW